VRTLLNGHLHIANFSNAIFCSRAPADIISTYTELLADPLQQPSFL